MPLETPARQDFISQSLPNGCTDDLLELSKLMSYNLHPLDHGIAQEGSDHTGTTPPLAAGNTFWPPSEITSPSEISPTISDIETPNWLRDEPSYVREEPMDCNNLLSSQVSNSSNNLTNPQEPFSISYIDLPHSLDRPPFLCMPTNQLDRPPFLCMPTNQLGVQEFISQAAVVQSSGSDHQFSKQAFGKQFHKDSFKYDEHPSLKTLDYRQAHQQRGSSLIKCSQRDLLDVKEVQVSQQLEGKANCLSISDTKSIQLKVLEVQDTSQESKDTKKGVLDDGNMGFHDSQDNGINEILDCIPKWTSNASASHAFERMEEHQPQERLMTEETFKDPFAIDLQDLTYLKSLDQNFREKFWNIKLNRSCQNDSESTLTMGAHNITNGLHLSTSLSTLSDFLTIQPSEHYQSMPCPTKPPSIVSPIDCFSFGSMQGLGVHSRDISSFCTSSSSQLMVVSHPSFSSLPLETMSLTPSYMFKQEAFSKNSRAHRLALHNKLIVPSINARERNVSSNHGPLECTTSLVTNDLGSLHQRSPAAKTRAAQKRRMAKNRISNQSRIILQEATKSLAWSSTLQSHEDRILPNSLPKQRASTNKPTIGMQMLGSEAHLRFLLQKELKPSDVGTLGRIILPKKDAEAHLPDLSAREGVSLLMEDMEDSRVWNFRFRFWPNNKSRMYLLENTRDFVKAHRLQGGDFLMIYKDDHAGKFIIRAKKVAQLDNTPIAYGRRAQFVQGKHTVMQDNQCHAKNTILSGDAMEEDLQKSLLVENLDYEIQELPKLENDGLPQLDHVSSIEANDVPIEEMFELDDDECNYYGR